MVDKDNDDELEAYASDPEQDYNDTKKFEGNVIKSLNLILFKSNI